MLDHELSPRDYVKAEYRRRLRAGPLATRSEGSLEFKFRNICAILNEAGAHQINRQFRQLMQFAG